MSSENVYNVYDILSVDGASVLDILDGVNFNVEILENNGEISVGYIKVDNLSEPYFKSLGHDEEYYGYIKEYVEGLIITLTEIAEYQEKITLLELLKRDSENYGISPAEGLFSVA